jgi:DNA-binding CsgD family transcriptional regulator
VSKQGWKTAIASIYDALRMTGLGSNPVSPKSQPSSCDVLKLIVRGQSNKEIARTLHIAEGTVKIHVAALLRRLGVNRHAAVAIARGELRSLSSLEASQSVVTRFIPTKSQKLKRKGLSYVLVPRF